ncbi:MAG TPA: TadE/TadG family type IV pilus assembly protein [Steroidobacteraceae bacterium]|nr:TadE/TadG family type IV pilus assembly protein [Steroidobacteraceae bacterium]
MSLLRRLYRNVRASAAAEMALVAPLLAVLMMGSAELGNYFYSEHILMKAVRDGARYAARQSFTYYPAPCTQGAAVGDPVLTNTRTLVKTGVLSGGTDRLVNWNATTISVTMNCATTATDLSASTQNMTGIYLNRAGGAPLVTVAASVPYTPVLAAFGFRGVGLSLNASEQAAVMGI